jgi:hypothetical protein
MPLEGLEAIISFRGLLWVSINHKWGRELLEIPYRSTRKTLVRFYTVWAKGLYIKTGGVSIVDATVIEAKQSRPRKGKDEENTQDIDAGYNVKIAANGKKTSTFGYKAHVNVDEDGFIS